jgi:hypothetical protein
VLPNRCWPLRHTCSAAGRRAQRRQAFGGSRGEPHQLRGSHLRLDGSAGSACGPTELPARVGIIKQSLGEFVAALEQAGYVTVTVDPRDRRARIVTPTARAVGSSSGSRTSPGGVAGEQAQGGSAAVSRFGALRRFRGRDVTGSASASAAHLDGGAAGPGWWKAAAPPWATVPSSMELSGVSRYRCELTREP